MEEAIQVLVFIVIITSVIIGKYKEVHANRPGQPIQKPQSTDNDQEIPFDGNDFEEYDDFIKPEEDDLKEDTAADNLEQIGQAENPDQIRDFPSQDDTHIHTIINPRTQSQKEVRVRFKTRKVARRAFIYSEIFNRKYE